MDTVVIPFSPVDLISPHACFSSNEREAEEKRLRENLKTSIGQILRNNFDLIRRDQIRNP